MGWQLIFIADWALIAFSFFNTITTLWLGLTVLLNAEQRRWGTWVVGGGLLMGGLIFAAHSAVVGRAIGTFDAEMELWWQLGWLPFIAAPYLWYLGITWFAGVSEHRLYRIWTVVVTVLGITGFVLLSFENSLPSYRHLFAPQGATMITLGGIPAALLIYPVYSVLCIVLALVALNYPAASERFMGDLARRRARPWLVAASLVLLLVALAAGFAASAILLLAREARLPDLSPRSLAVLIGFDLLISGLIALIIVLAGQAIVSYEIFTGTTLPRGGLSRHWRTSLLIAASFSAVIGWSLSQWEWEFDPIYQLVLATLLMTSFLALLSWRAYLDHEHSMRRLRPFVVSQGLYERLLHPLSPGAVDVAAPFRALCAEVLDASLAYLVPLGPLAPLVAPGLAYPAGRLPPAADDLVTHFAGPQTFCVKVDPALYGGAIWAVPLWSERGLIGVLLIGEKADGGLYTHEEIEIARAAGERLIDTSASAALAGRLMDLQRRRLAEGQVLDRRTRRVLHDEVLPQIHAAILQSAASAGPNGTAQATITALQAQLTAIHRQIADLLHDIPVTAGAEVARIGLIAALQRAIDRELGDAFEEVCWQIEGDVEEVAQRMAPLSAEVVFYAAREAVRNAARYGRGGQVSRLLHLSITATYHMSPAPGLAITVEDDGVGISGAPASNQGSGRGLALHSTMMAVIGGALTVESRPGNTRIMLTVPVE